MIPGVTPVPLPAEAVQAWKSETDPPPEWYRFFSSMQYHIRPVPNSGLTYCLTPVVGRPVYTFDKWEDFIDGARDLASVLMDGINVPIDVPQYRAMVGPPRIHWLYRLKPYWRFTSWGGEDVIPRL